jgi:pimeloyl-ACP methyl ester carboxylesterase
MTTAPDLRDALGALRCPTLVVCGDGDRIAPPECSRRIARAIAGARLELLADWLAALAA